MSVRTVVLSAASVMIGIALTATASTGVLARIPTGTTRLHHHHHHRGQLRHPLIMPPATVGRGSPASPYCWPYDYTYDPYEYCGASYIVSW
jgi:hypothetical protein